MKKHRLKTAACVGLTLGIAFAGTASADAFSSIMQVGQAKTAAAQQSQKRIDKLADETSSLLSDYKTVNKEIDGLKIYNQRLDIQIENQSVRMQELDDSIAQVTVIQRQMTPLILRMIDGLEQFVELDMPFHEKERSDRIAFLKANVDRSDISTSEKFRQVLEAFKIESEYGRKIDTYKDEIQIDGMDKEREVDILRVGRIALLFQSTDKDVTGAWSDGAWKPLESGDYRNAVSNGIRIAKKQASIDILNLPIAAPEAAQ